MRMMDGRRGWRRVEKDGGGKRMMVDVGGGWWRVEENGGGEWWRRVVEEDGNEWRRLVGVEFDSRSAAADGTTRGPYPARR